MAAEPRILRVTAGPEAAGLRLDRFLADAIGTLSRSRVKALIEAGAAARDGSTLREPDETVRAGAAYTLDLPPPTPARPQPQAIPFPILYEDADLIVLDKPAGLVVHPAPGNLDGTLVNALLAHCGPDFTGIGAERRPGYRAPAGQGHLRRHGGGEDPAGQRCADRGLRRARPGPRLPGAGLGRAVAAGR